jgi:hypothetical protein
MEAETDMETETDIETETDMGRKRTWKRKRNLTIHGYGHGHGHEYVHGIGKLLLSISYSAIVPMAPYGMPLKYHSAISNGSIYL